MPRYKVVAPNTKVYGHSTGEVFERFLTPAIEAALVEAGAIQRLAPKPLKNAVKPELKPAPKLEPKPEPPAAPKPVEPKPAALTPPIAKPKDAAGGGEEEKHAENN